MTLVWMREEMNGTKLKNVGAKCEFQGYIRFATRAYTNSFGLRVMRPIRHRACRGLVAKARTFAAGIIGSGAAD